MTKTVHTPVAEMILVPPAAPVTMRTSPSDTNTAGHIEDIGRLSEDSRIYELVSAMKARANYIIVM